HSTIECHAFGLLTLALAAALGGCTSDIEKERPNLPPETRITSGPPDSTAATSYRVELAWSGNDPDGVVDHYDVLVVDHPAEWDSITGDDVNRVVITPPTADDSRWHRTTRLDSTIVVSADTLRRNPVPGLHETPGDVLRQAFERWHTVFVRAVDDHGASDP